MKTDEQIRARVITVLAKKSPLRTWEVQRSIGGGGAQADDFWRVLDGLVRDGTVWHEGGALSLNGDVEVPATSRARRNPLPESSEVPGVIRRG